MDTVKYADREVGGGMIVLKLLFKSSQIYKILGFISITRLA